MGDISTHLSDEILVLIFCEVVKSQKLTSLTIVCKHWNNILSKHSNVQILFDSTLSLNSFLHCHDYKVTEDHINKILSKLTKTTVYKTKCSEIYVSKKMECC